MNEQATRRFPKITEHGLEDLEKRTAHYNLVGQWQMSALKSRGQL